MRRIQFGKKPRPKLLESVQESRPGKPPKADSDYLAWIRTLPCVFASEACEGPTEAHHRTGGGMGLKTSDRETIPLCARHHKDRHDHTGPFFQMTKAERKDWEAMMVDRYRAIRNGSDF